MDKFKNVLNSFNLDNNKPLILSVSAGVDSMVLADLLLKNNKKIVIVHFNHNTRDNNIKEEELVINYGKDNNIKVHVFNIKVSSGNFQEEARLLRYNHLREIAIKYKTPYIVTAHHLDDLAETIILKTIRGSNLYGYAGIHKEYSEGNFTYLKPLIETTKQSIINYAITNNINYLEDESNYNDTYSRNRIRHAVIPILKQESPVLLEKMLEYHNTLKDAFNYIRKTSSNYLLNNEINIQTFNPLEQIIKDDILALLLERYKININKNLISDLNNIIDSSKPNIEYNLSDSYVFIKAYNTCFIKEKEEDLGFVITLKEDINVLPNMKKITFLSNGVNKDENHIKICYNNLELPLIARTRKNGDLVKFSYGTKKVKDLFIDLKVPKEKRDKLIIITDSSDNIIYIENIYINKTLGNENELFFIIENHKGDI